ncbi:MAG TPA: chemotaxis protein CheB [Spongiibacteraceae bacterium]|nr:chemotaxis protein CheB [Spongiibacteraceae bacterium]
MSRQLFGPQIGIVAGSDLSRHMLKSLLLESGYGARCIDPRALQQCLQGDPNQPDAWLLDSSDPDIDQLVAQIVQFSDTPFLVNDECPSAQPDAVADWRRRVLDKLEELVASAASAPYADIEAPHEIWVLAASTGGPEAVGEFLAALRPGLPIAMVYAQHIEPGFDRVLKSALERHRHYPSTLCRGEQYLRKGSLLVVPADQQVRFLPFHRVLETRHAWEGRYQPAIDQVVGDIARRYPHRCGVIVFSGLCDDGALGCRVMQANDGEIWVQSPASCVSPDMPNAALATGKVSVQGSPAQLAQVMNSRYSQ